MTTASSFGQPFTHDRLRGFRLKADGDWADSFLGINQVNVTFSQGIPRARQHRRNPTTRSRRAAGVGRVDFTKIESTVSRTQPLPANFSLFVAGYAQYAFTPLLVSEQCGYGGRFFGRAFDPSQMLGDHCWAALGELRYDIATPWKQLTRLQPYAYADHGQTYILQAGRRHAAHAARHLGRRRRARRLGGHLHGRRVAREGGRRPAQ